MNKRHDPMKTVSHDSTCNRKLISEYINRCSICGETNCKVHNSVDPYRDVSITYEEYENMEEIKWQMKE